MTGERRRWHRKAPEVRRLEMLDAAEALIRTSGFDAMTMSQVAEQAGVGKGTLYLYFGSKAELLEGLQTRYWDSMLETAQAGAARKAASWTARLDHVVDDLLDFGVQNDELFHALFDEVASADPRSISAFTAVVADVLRGGQAAGEFVLIDLEMTASFIASASNGMAPQLIDAPKSRRRQKVRLFQGLLHRVVGAA